MHRYHAFNFTVNTETGSTKVAYFQYITKQMLGILQWIIKWTLEVFRAVMSVLKLTEQKIMNVGMASDDSKLITSFTEIGWFQIIGKKDMIPLLGLLQNENHVKLNALSSRMNNYKIPYPTAWYVLPTVSGSLTAFTIAAATSDTKTGCFTVCSPFCQSGRALIWWRKNLVYELPTDENFTYMAMADSK